MAIVWGSVQNIINGLRLRGRERERLQEKTTFWLFGNNGRTAIHSFGLFCSKNPRPNRIAMGTSSGRQQTASSSKWIRRHYTRRRASEVLQAETRKQKERNKDAKKGREKEEKR